MGIVSYFGIRERGGPQVFCYRTGRDSEEGAPLPFRLNPRKHSPTEPG